MYICITEKSLRTFERTRSNGNPVWRSVLVRIGSGNGSFLFACLCVGGLCIQFEEGALMVWRAVIVLRLLLYMFAI